MEQRPKDDPNQKGAVERLRQIRKVGKITKAFTEAFPDKPKRENT